MNWRRPSASPAFLQVTSSTARRPCAVVKRPHQRPLPFSKMVPFAGLGISASLPLAPARTGNHVHLLGEHPDRPTQNLGSADDAGLLLERVQQSQVLVGKANCRLLRHVCHLYVTSGGLGATPAG